MSAESREPGRPRSPDPALDKSPGARSRHVRRDCAALRPAQHGAVRRPRSLLAPAWRSVARLTGRERCSTCAPAPATWRSRRPRRARRAPRRRRRFRRRDARARPRARCAGGGSATACSWSAAMRCICRWPSASVDAVTIAFGIRNVQQPEAACRRVASACCGRVAGWRSSSSGRRSSRSFGPLYSGISGNVLPRIGRAVSRHDAAYYLSARSPSASFPTARHSRQLLRVAGI